MKRKVFAAAFSIIRLVLSSFIGNPDFISLFHDLIAIINTVKPVPINIMVTIATIIFSMKPQNVDWLKSIIGVLKNYKERFGCEALVLDSLAAVYALTTFKNPRGELFSFFEQIRDLGVTTFLISEMPTDREVYGLYGIEDFLSDGILHLKVEQTSGGANLYLGVVKMRKTHHTREFMPLIFENGRFEVIRQ